MTRPVHTFTTADGLPTNAITCIKSDSHGFLWFCTTEGLSRFDGYTFVNYGVDQGLPDRYVSAFLETRSGDYWVGTARGLAHFNPKPGPKAPMFTVIGYGSDKTQPINDLLEDRQGTIWVAISRYGLLRLVPSNGQWALQRSDVNPTSGSVEGLLEDHEGNLWIAIYGVGGSGSAQLCRRSPNGHVDTFTGGFLQSNRILSITGDRENNICLGSYRGVALLVAHPQPSAKLIEHVYSQWFPGMRPEIRNIFQSSDGRRWVRSYGLVFEMLGDPRTGNVRFRLYDRHGMGP